MEPSEKPNVTQLHPQFSIVNFVEWRRQKEMGSREEKKKENLWLLSSITNITDSTTFLFYTNIYQTHAAKHTIQVHVQQRNSSHKYTA